MSRKLRIRYSTELGNKICDAISTTPHGLEKICQMYDFFPVPKTIHEWKEKYPEFSDNYTRARLKQTEIFIEHIVDIAEKSTKDSWQRDRFLVDTHKWIASKLLPKKYGDKYITEHRADDDEEKAAERKEIIANMDAKNKRDY